MIPVNQFLPGSLASLLRNAPLSPEKVAFAWRTAVGAAVERATDVTLDTDGTLRVVAREPSWEREILRSQPMILPRLQALLGEDVVRKIEVRSA